MKTLVSILHHDYPTRIRALVDGKLQDLARFHERVVSLRALLERQNEEHRVELVANVGQGTVLVADVRGASLASALDEALDRMGAQLRKVHDKRTRGRHRRGRIAR